jgi:hypothetical protein
MVKSLRLIEKVNLQVRKNNFQDRDSKFLESAERFVREIMDKIQRANPQKMLF